MTLADIDDASEISLLDHRSPLEAPSATPLWVAMGVIIGPSTAVPPAGSEHGTRFFHQSFVSKLPNTISWSFVTTSERHRGDPRFVIVRCRDGPFDHWPDGATMSRDQQDTAYTAKQSACACKSYWWFRRALHLFPKARFIGKTEDDAAVHDARLVAELRLAHGRYPSAPLWFGMFQWAGLNPSSRRNGWYCGDGDGLLTRREPYCPQPTRGVSESLRKLANATHAYPNATTSKPARYGRVVAPFPSGGLDVRSRSLAEAMSACDEAEAYMASWTSSERQHGGCEDYRTHCGENEWAGACDGIFGYLLAACMRAGAGVFGQIKHIHAVHLPMWAKFTGPPPRVSTTVIHGGALEELDKLPSAHGASWKWHKGAALLPIDLRLTLSHRTGGIRWEPKNQTLAKAYVNARADDGGEIASNCIDDDDSTPLPCAALPSGAELRLEERRRVRK